LICINQGLDSKICRQALSIIIEDLKLQKIFHTLFGKNGYMVTMIAGKEPTIVKDGNCLPSSEK